MNNTHATNLKPVEELIETTARLRAPGGCPWDREQTHESLRKYLIEEAYEVLEAIDRGSSAALLEELGDVLFQVCLHAQIEAEKGNFDFAAVADRVNKKMVSRHPHVFGDVTGIEKAEDVVHQWEKIKAEEKKDESSPFAGIPKQLPSLFRATKVLKKADKLKLATEKLIQETVQVASRDKINEALAQIVDEESLAGVLLLVVERAKKLKIDPEEALRGLTAKIQVQFEGQIA